MRYFNYSSMYRLQSSFLIAFFGLNFITSNASVIPPTSHALVSDVPVIHESHAARSIHPFEAQINPSNHHDSGKESSRLVERILWKRGSCFSRPSQPNVFQCSAETPTVAECVSQIETWGQVGTLVSVFYTGLGGAGGVTQCKQYLNCHPEIGQTVLWDNIADPTWFEAQTQAIYQGNPSGNPNIILDPFQKRMSQAFAEASKGDAYLCTPEDNSPDNNFNQNLAWGGWEYPALTRNSQVTKIIRVDPATGVTNQIWTAGQPPTANGPKG